MLEMTPAIEAILFAAGEPVPAARIAQVLGVQEDEVFACAETMAADYHSRGRGIRLVRIRESLQLCSAPEQADYVLHALEQRRPPRLTQPLMEVLAAVAYFQPVTRAYIEQLRGVDSGYTVNALLERGLIEVCGKLEAPGRPNLYRTTERFLRAAGISDVEQLPPLPEQEPQETAQTPDAVQAEPEAALPEDGGASQ
ncbi:MAG: SMC-Scp complex subunit ScpB [Clostridiales bacterium]|nr:SMC-Scp complex subunit ScpB [Clostridiales bacterium]